ncbi:MAG: LPS assembly protein LptD [Alphaproteobacteria bacterium]|nr:LPS assembly protein LptD [Alphaproteobacteria bacterium]
MPPLGYVGPVPRAAETTAPPIGYVGEMPHVEASATALSASASFPPPLGYVGPMPPVAMPVKPQPVANEAASHTGETLITAKQMHSDSAAGIITAIGKVEIVRGDYVLHADKVTYNQKTGVMTADGHVALLTPTGDVEFAEHEEITGDMKQAFAQNVGILFLDNSRMAAQTTQRYEGRYTLADHAVYTACNICRKNPDRQPLWQLQADTITHDNTEHEIYYHDATIDFAGVPVAYTPYLSSPDPTVKRAQGFLSPMPGETPNIGAFLKTPYYFDIAPDKDATLTPTFSTVDKLQVAGQYRERFAKGSLMLDGSVTKADLIDTNSGIDRGQQWRGDLMGKFRTDLDDIWRAGSDIQYASDRSYLHRYDITSLDQTISDAYLEGFKGRDYLSVNSYYFQDLRAGVNTPEPVILPSMSFSALGDPGQAWGGRWSLDGNTLVTQRENANKPLAQQGPDTRRLSLNAGWQRQFISTTGLETTVSGLARTDSYWANNVVTADNSDVYNQALFTRAFEQGNAVMRYPMGRSGDGYQQLLEPIVAVTAAPDVRQISKLPNEDSLDVEFDEANLFSPNRFTGSDLIEGGSRATYGLRNAITADNGAHIDVFGGESYDFTANSDFPDLSGLNGHASDYVGRIDFSPAPWMEANYGFRLAESDLSPQRQDALLSVGAPVFRPSARYIEAYETDATTGLIDQVKQITLGLSSTFAKYWTVTGSHTQAFDPQPGPRYSNIQLIYVDECFAFGVNLSRDDTNRVDISSGTSVAFHFYLKNLGGMHTDSVSSVMFPAAFRQTAP